VGLAPVLVAAAMCGCVASQEDSPTEVVRRGPFSVWSVYDGVLEARRVEVVMSEFSGSATIVELAPEGAEVEAGDLLVRFDEATVRTELLKLERDLALAKSDMASLEQAELPLELRDLSLQWLEAQGNHDVEKQFLDDSIELAREGLISEQEVAQQRLKVDQARTRLENIEVVRNLTQQYLHPSRMERARATLEAAEQQYKLAREQLERCNVRAPSSGVVVYQPLHMGADYRAVRVGDNIYKNQAFMAIPDMSDVVVRCSVPEAELSHVGPGSEVVVVPLAYPDLRLKGRIESVGSMAQTLPGRASWQKFFSVVIGVEEVNPLLRSGMSVRATILSYRQDEAVLVPRAAVWWEADTPFCMVKTWTGASARRVKLGHANYGYYEVLDGLTAGEVTVLQ
jgi:multidrug resistance efflux pump